MIRKPAPKVMDHHVGFNGRLACWITQGVGTMWCAYAFAALSLVSLPAAIRSHDPVTIVSWLSQTFLQLVLLSIIAVGQQVLGRAADSRADQTWHDAELVLQRCIDLEKHLQAQDRHLAQQDALLQHR